MIQVDFVLIIITEVRNVIKNLSVYASMVESVRFLKLQGKGTVWNPKPWISRVNIDIY